MKNWFPHDYTASRDVKILAILRAGGGLYYGLYWATVEAMHTEHAMAFDDLVMYLAFAMNAEDQQIKDFLHAALKAKLMQMSEEGIVTIDRVTRNLEQRNEISERRRQSVAKRWAKKQDTDTNVKQSDTPALQHDTGALQSHTIDTNLNNKSIQNHTHNNTDIHNRQDKTRQDTTPQRDSLSGAPQGGVRSVIDYFVTHNSTETEARKMFAYYDALGWILNNGRTVENWRSLADLWILRPNGRGNGDKAKRGDRAQGADTLQDYVLAMAESAKQRIEPSSIQPQYVVLQPPSPPGILPEHSDTEGQGEGDAG